MRVLRRTLAAAGLLGLAPALALAQSPAQPLLERFVPAQKDAPVEYDTPADKAAIDACKVEVVEQGQRKIGHAVRDGQGRLLRRFVDTNGKLDKQNKPHLDQWSYYQNGFEVYREIDLDEDGAIDECRWLNSGGTKIAAVRDNKIVAWKRLSAEEASKLMVQALVAGNGRVIDTLLATPEELAALGVPAPEVERVKQERAARPDALKALQGGLVGWGRQTAWQRFDGTMPHVIPADAGLKDDLVLYENAFIFVEGDPMKTAYLQAPELIRVGDSWKFASLPRAANPANPVANVVDTGIRAALFRGGEVDPPTVEKPDLKRAIEDLAQHDQAAPGPNATNQELAQWHVERVKLLHEVIVRVEGDDAKLNYTKQAVDSLAAAYQTGLYEAGGKKLDEFAAQPGPIASYAAYRKLLAVYGKTTNEPGANLLQVQKDLLAQLETFVDRFPRADETPEALFQLASINEFNAEEDKARTYYERLVQEKPDSDPGKKAAGALRRLDLVGKPLDLRGPTLDGKGVDAAQYKGKTLLVAFWTSAADTQRRDLPELKKVYDRYRAKGFEIVGVSLDSEKEALDAFLKQNPLPWPQVFEPGGMDSPLADSYGIISLPTMILVDAQGKVVNRNIRTAAELDRFLERMIGAEKAASAPRDERR